MKRLFAVLLAGLVTTGMAAQNMVYTEASDLTIVGKLMPGMTSNVYHRVDTVRYKGFNEVENLQVRETSGMSCAFRTNSRTISIQTVYGEVGWPYNTNGISARGYNLYIKKDGRWLFAGTAAPERNQLDKAITIAGHMDGSEHECLLYFPLYSEEYSIKIGVEQGSTLEALENPFRHRIAIWGSSYTHGSSTSRSGMTYPAIFSRRTGLQMLSLGCSGNCRLQDYFCDVLCDVEADAFVFDCFSNPNARTIRAKLQPFIDRMIAAHPGKPMIFQQTIYRENRLFDTKLERTESEKMHAADSIMRAIKSTPEGRKKYKDVYFIHPDCSTKDHEGQVDGTHPGNYGYSLWEASIEKKIVRILRRYGIR